MPGIYLSFFYLVIICEAFSQIHPKPDSLNQALKQIPSANIFPNPARDKVIINIRGFSAGMLQLKIVGTNGKVYRKDTRLLYKGDEEMVLMFFLDPGIYYILFTQPEKNVKKKLVVR
jgi:hypothetical protein